MRKIIIFLLFVVFLHADGEYELGEGYQVGSLPFYIGGYFSLDYRNIDDEHRYRIDDIAILGYGSYEKFSYVTELEYKEFYVKTHGNNKKSSTNNRHLYVERVSLDYNFDENYIFRVGKFSSPVGYWNLLPVNVLRETTSTPMSVSIIFPKLTTGISASYSSYNEGEFKLDVHIQDNKDIDSDYNNYEINKHYGLGVEYVKDEYSVKLNTGHFYVVDGSLPYNDLYYILLSAKYESDKYQLLAEVGSQKTDSDFTTDYAGYIQGLYRFTEQHLGILRVESFEKKALNKNDDIAILGYTYRPLYPVAIKSEYQFHTQSENNKFLFSFSVMF